MLLVIKLFFTDFAEKVVICISILKISLAINCFGSDSIEETDLFIGEKRTGHVCLSLKLIVPYYVSDFGVMELLFF